MSFSDKDHRQQAWAQRQTGQRFALPAQRMASTHAFVDAALLGLAWGMNPEPLAAAHIASGALRELSPETPLDTPPFWQFSRLTTEAIAPVTRAVRHAADARLVPVSRSLPSVPPERG